MSHIITTLLSALLATALGTVTATLYAVLVQTRFRTGKLNPSPHYTEHANTNSLMKQIAKVDQIFAQLFYWLIITVGLALLLIALLDILGLFDYIGWL